MTRFLDTSVLVAAVLPWHEHHRAAQTAILRARAGKGGAALAGRTLVEAYAVLTRLPSPHRLAGADAQRLLELNFRDLPIHVLDGDELWSLLGDAPDEGVTGGATYDAEIVRTAARAGARGVLTLDRRGYGRSAPRELEIEIVGT